MGGNLKILFGEKGIVCFAASVSKKSPNIKKTEAGYVSYWYVINS